MATPSTSYTAVRPQQRVVDGVDDGRDMFNSEQVEHDIVGMFADDNNEDGDTEQTARRVVHQWRQHRPPTEQEVEDHRRTHQPSRSWCPHCVAGRTRADEKERGVAFVLLHQECC